MNAIACLDRRQRLALLLSAPVLVACGMALVAAPWQAALAFVLTGGVLAAIVCYRPVLYPLLFLAPFESNFLGIATYYRWSVKEIDLFPLYPFLLVFPLAGLALSRLARAGRPQFPDAMQPVLAAFAAWSILSMVWAPLFVHSLLHCSIVVCNILLYFYVVGVVDDEAFLRRVMNCLIFYGVLIAAANILVRYSPQVVYKVPLLEYINFEFYIRGMETNFRSRSIANDNMTAYTQNLFMCITAAHLLYTKGLMRRLLLTFAMIFMFFGMLLCQSKAGTISFVIMIGYFIVVFARVRRYFFLWAPIATGLFFVVFYAQTRYLDDPKTPRLLYQLGTESLSWRWRVDLWTRFWSKLASGSLLEGLGAGGLIYDAHVPHAHSIYFSVLFDFGLVGFSLMLVGMVILTVRFVRQYRRQETYPQVLFVALCGGLITMAVQGLFDSSYLMPVVTLFLGLTSASYALAQRGVTPYQG